MATDRPMPELAPVTSAFWPSSGFAVCDASAMVSPHSRCDAPGLHDDPTDGRTGRGSSHTPSKSLFCASRGLPTLSATAAIIAVHFLPPPVRARAVGLRIKRSVVAALAITAAMPLAVMPPAAPIGDVLSFARGHRFERARRGRRGLGGKRAQPQAGEPQDADHCQC